MSHLAVLPRVLLIYIAAFLILVLGAGCTSSDDSKPAPTQTTPAQTENAAPAATAEPTAAPADQSANAGAATGQEQKQATGGKKMHAIMDTTMGKIKILLYNDKAPKTVENFVGLAEGTKEFTNPKTGKKEKRPYYDGIIFHRVIDGFMIQGGDPTGTGMGGPGYTFADEFHPEAKHTKPGILSMANAGPNTNGSQFFITVAPTDFLDFDHPRNKPRNGGHAVFGEVVEGMDVVYAISKVPRDSNDRPKKEVKINSVKIER